MPLIFRKNLTSLFRENSCDLQEKCFLGHLDDQNTYLSYTQMYLVFVHSSQLIIPKVLKLLRVMSDTFKITDGNLWIDSLGT